MANRVKLSQDGSTISFSQTDNMPTTAKKFRKSPDIIGFYQFVYENSLQREAFEILDTISLERKAAKVKAKKK